MEYYSATKKNETMPFAATWMALDTVILSEVGQRKITQGTAYKWNPKKKKKRLQMNLYTKQK